MSGKTNNKSSSNGSSRKASTTAAAAQVPLAVKPTSTGSGRRSNGVGCFNGQNGADLPRRNGIASSANRTGEGSTGMDLAHGGNAFGADGGNSSGASTPTQSSAHSSARRAEKEGKK